MCQAWGWVLETCGPKGLLGAEDDVGSGVAHLPPEHILKGNQVLVCVAGMCMHVCMSSPVHSAKMNALPEG